MGQDPTAGNEVLIALLAVFGTIGAGLLAFLGNIVVVRWKAKSDLAIAKTQLEAHAHDTAGTTAVNIAQIADEHIKMALQSMQGQIKELQSQNEEKDKTIERHLTMHQQNAERIADLERHVKIGDKVLLQTEKQLRFYDETLGIIRWEADGAGNIVYVNKHFIECTGISERDVLKDRGAWFEAVAEHHAEDLAFKWNNLLAGQLKALNTSFTFKNRLTDELTPVTVNVETIYGLGDEVYRFTARTKPLYLINAELRLENRKLTDENEDLLLQNLQLIGATQDSPEGFGGSSINR